jgi:hypothetical protein
VHALIGDIIALLKYHNFKDFMMKQLSNFFSLIVFLAHVSMISATNEKNMGIELMASSI